jgi:hypothetical protein
MRSARHQRRKAFALGLNHGGLLYSPGAARSGRRDLIDLCHCEFPLL